MVEWSTRTVQQLVNEGILDRPLDGNHGSIHPKGSDFVENGIPFIAASDLHDGRIDTTTCKFISQETAANLRKGFSQNGDVLLSHKATLGRTAILSWPSDQFVVLTPQVTYYRVREDEKLNRRYLKYYFDSRPFQNTLNAWASDGSTRLYLAITKQLRLPVVLPPIHEQRAIAHVLGSLDDKIELNRRMNETLEQMAAAIFKAWFVNFEPVKAKADGAKSFPSMPQKVFDALPTEFTDSPLGPIPKGWDVRAIADLARFVNGRAFTKHANGQGRMIIRIAELNSGPGGSTKYGEIEVDAENTAYPDDILFPWSGSLGVYRWHRAEAIINQHIFKVIPEGYPKWFVFFALLDALLFFRSVAAGKATTMGHIQRHHLSDAKLAVAPDDLVEAAGVLVEPMYAMIHANEMQSGMLAAIRDALLPKLLSGEIRVGEAARIAEEVA